MSELMNYCSCVLKLPSCGAGPAAEPRYPDDYDVQKWIAISWSICVTCVVGLGLYAIVRYTMWTIRQNREETAEEFCTARRSQGKWRIAYSFFASAVGAWCISAPPSFAVYNGILGLAMYATASGLPVFVLALCGSRIVGRHSSVVSVGDFAGQRFGPVFKTIVMLLCLFNMSIAMTAEYTTIGSLFQDYVGSYSWPAIILVGAVTMCYTVYGGLSISIITDQVQAILTICFITVLTTYVAVTFRAPLPKPLPNDLTMSQDPVTGYVSWPLGINKNGLSAVFSMPVSLMSSTVFSEAMWQKVWASEDRQATVFGGAVGGALITVAVFLFGFGGWLAAWGGSINHSTNANLFLFQVFDTNRALSSPGAAMPLSPLAPGSSFPPATPPAWIYDGLSARVSSWIGVVTLMLAVTMNESAVDSLQNGITSCIATHFFRDQNILFTRILVVCINIPLMIIASNSLAVLQLFLMTNMLTTCWFLPVLAGLWDWTTNFVGETGAVFGGTLATLSTIAYSSGKYWSTAGNAGDAIECGSWYAWYGNVNYDWDQFLVAAASSVLGMLLWAVPASLLRRQGVNGPGISGLLGRVPGFKFVTGGGLDCDLLGVLGLGRFSAPQPVQPSPNTEKLLNGLEVTKEFLPAAAGGAVDCGRGEAHATSNTYQRRSPLVRGPEV